MNMNTDLEQKFLELMEPINLDDLRGWDRDFISDLREKYDEKGADTFISPKMWVQLERISGRF